MSEKAVMIQLTEQELIILSNAINESLEALEDWEFATRMGASREEADNLHKKLSVFLSSIEDG